MASCLMLCFTNVCAQEKAQQRLSIEQMFELAEQNNSRIKAHETALKQAEQEVKVAKNGYLPSIEASLSVSYNGDGTILDRDFSNSFKAEIPDFGNSFALEVSQVIYAGGAIKYGVKMSQLQSQIAQLDAERNRQEVRFLIVGSYLDLIKMENQLKVLDSHIAQTDEVLRQMRIRHEQGVALSNDITRYELQLQNLNYMHLQLENGKRIVNNQLLQALGLPDGVEIVPDEPVAENGQGKDASYWQNEAALSAIPVRMAETAVKMSEYKQKLSNAERMPQMALFAMNNLTGPVTIEIPAIDKNFNYWAVGVGVKYNIGNLYKSNKKVARDKLGIQKAREEREVAAEGIRLAMQAAYIHYEEAFDLLKTKQKSVALATENYQVVNYRYSNDLALITDLLDAASQKLDAELQAVNANIQILYNYYKLHYIAGTL